MLFRFNIYRLGEERRLQERNRTRALAIVVLLVGLNVVTIALYAQALWNTNQGLSAASSRLAEVQRSMEEISIEGEAITEEQVDLLRVRSAQPQWRALMGRVGALTPDNIWYMRLKYVSPTENGLGEEHVLRVYGQVKAKSRDQSVNELMEYVDVLRTDPLLAKGFGTAKLSAMRWSEDSDQEYLRGLHFEVDLPIISPRTTGGGHDDA